jgi:hypothetical protein
MRRDSNKSKRKRSHSSSEEDDDDATDAIATHLAAYGEYIAHLYRTNLLSALWSPLFTPLSLLLGERFMSMFDDNKPTNKVYKKNTAEDEESPPFEEDQDIQSNGFDTDESSGDDDFNHIFNAKNHASKTSKNNATNTTSKIAGSSKIPAIAPLIDPKLERKRFMSQKADKILSKPESTRSGKSFKDREAVEDGALSREEFQKLRREVHQYGMSSLACFIIHRGLFTSGYCMHIWGSLHLSTWIDTNMALFLSGEFFSGAPIACMGTHTSTVEAHSTAKEVFSTF